MDSIQDATKDQGQDQVLDYDWEIGIWTGTGSMGGRLVIGVLAYVSRRISIIFNTLLLTTWLEIAFLAKTEEECYELL